MGYIETDPAFYRKVLTIALPVAAQSVITTGVNLVDTIMLGQLGEVALSSSTLANQFVMLFTFLCMGISMGSSVLTSRFWGAGDLRSLKKVITIALRFGALLAFVFTLADVLWSRQIMAMYTHETDVILQGAVYLQWSTTTFVLTALSTILTNIMRSVNLPRVPFVAAASAFFVNIGANYVFIFGKFGAPAMGVAGAALGTVIARVVECGMICGYFLLVDTTVSYRIKDLFSHCGDMLGEFLRVSLPVMFSDGLLGIGDSAIAMVMGRIGAQFVSANAITVVVQRISTIVITGIAFASCFITGHTLGEGRVETAKKHGTTFAVLGFAIGILAGGIIFLISTPVINAYNIAPETKAIARQLMNAMSILVIFRAANSILTKGVLRGGGDTKFLLVADTAAMWFIAIPLGILTGLVLKISPFWLFFCLQSDQVIKTFWCLWRLRSGKWIKTVKGARLED